MNHLKIRTFDGIAIASLLILPELFFTGFGKLVGQNHAAGWITLLISFVIMLCLFLITASLMERYEGRNIIEITSLAAGKSFSYIYGILLGLYFCYFTGIYTRECAEILKVYSLNLTPLYIIIGLIFFTAIMMNFLGGRSIVKSAGFFFLITVAGIIFIILLGINRYNPENLAPLLGNGFPQIIKNSFFTSSIFDCVIILFLFAPAFSNTAKMKKTGILSLFISSAIFVIMYLCYNMMFSPVIGSTMISGFIEMGKSIYYNHFFYRFESILLFFLIFSSVIQTVIGLFIVKESISCTFNLNTHDLNSPDLPESRPASSKILTVLCAVPALVFAFIPANILDLTQRYLPVIRQYSMFFIAGFPLLLLLICLLKNDHHNIRNKRGSL